MKRRLALVGLLLGLLAAAGAAFHLLHMPYADFRGELLINITDHGIGIPEAQVTRIFEEHFRSNNAAAHYANGNGIGLAMVKEIARLHGASISVKSTEGEGSVFTVRFPIDIVNKQGETNGTHTHHRR